MKFTTEHYTKNTREARNLLMDSGYKPYSIGTFDLTYLTITSDGYICGTTPREGFIRSNNLKELYAYEGAFHDTEKSPILCKQRTKLKRPTLSELLKIDNETLKQLQEKLTWKEALEYQLSRFYKIKKSLAEQLDSTNPEYSELLRLIKYYDGAIQDTKDNLC